MLLPNKMGISCDYCGSDVKGDFIYYSLDFIELHLRHRSVNKSDNIILSADLCERCIELFRQRLLEVAGAVPESLTRCDVSGADYGFDDQTLYKCKISRVLVSLSKQPYICPKCNKPRRLEDGPCDCSDDAVNLTCAADVDVDGDYLELNFSPNIFAKFKKHLESMRESGEMEWAKN